MLITLRTSLYLLNLSAAREQAREGERERERERLYVSTNLIRDGNAATVPGLHSIYKTAFFWELLLAERKKIYKNLSKSSAAARLKILKV